MRNNMGRKVAVLTGNQETPMNEPEPSTPPLVVSEVAAQLRLTDEWTRELIRGGKINAMKSGRKWLVAQCEVTRYLDSVNTATVRN